MGGMFRKINHVFRPNQQGARGGAASDGVAGSEQDYHSACTVRLVRSSSVVAVGGRGEAGPAVTRSRSTGSGGSEGRWPQRQEDPLWLPSQSRHCLEYLEALVELRRTYTRSVGDFSRSEAEEASAPPGKKPPPPPPPGGGRRGATLLYPPGKTPPEPPVPDEEDCLRYLDAVIASCDSEAQTKAYSDDGHADVDFIGEPPPLRWTVVVVGGGKVFVGVFFKSSSSAA